jgi:hypothetical protein
MAGDIAAHRQLPGGNVVLVSDNLPVHLRAAAPAVITLLHGHSG